MAEIDMISLVSIYCDCIVAFSKTYIQIYNGMPSRLGVRQNTVCELIMNEVICVEFVQFQQKRRLD